VGGLKKMVTILMITINYLSVCLTAWLIFVYTIAPVTFGFYPNNILTAVNAKPIYDLY